MRTNRIGFFCLVRTDTEAPKQEGISFLLFDMASDGVSASPIPLISGASPFCQVFFDNVKVPKNQLVGKLNEGWTIAKRLLQHERQMVSVITGNTPLAQSTKLRLEKLAQHYAGDGQQINDPILRAKICHHKIDGLAFKLTMNRNVEESAAGRGDGNAASLIKYYNSELNKRKFDLLLQVMGTAMLGWSGEGFSSEKLMSLDSGYDLALTLLEGNQRSAAQCNCKAHARFAGLNQTTRGEQMKLGLSIGYSGGEMRLPIEKVQLAERLGYDSVWTAEAYGSDALSPLAYLAAKTERIKLGTGVIQLAGRTPANAAMTIATIDALAGGGRVICGIGVSTPDRRRLVRATLGPTLLSN